MLRSYSTNAQIFRYLHSSNWFQGLHSAARTLVIHSETFVLSTIFLELLDTAGVYFLSTIEHLTLGFLCMIFLLPKTRVIISGISGSPVALLAWIQLRYNDVTCGLDFTCVRTFWRETWKLSLYKWCHLWKRTMYRVGMGWARGFLLDNSVTGLHNTIILTIVGLLQ